MPIADRVVERAAEPLLALPQRLLGRPPAPAKAFGLERLLDGPAETSQPILEQVVGGPELDALGRALVPDRARDADQRDVEPARLQELERPRGLELGQVVVGDDQLRLGRERRPVLALAVDPLPGGLDARSAQLAEDQLGVLRPVLDEEQAEPGGRLGRGRVRHGRPRAAG
jgi:hypothetical protein